MAAGREFCVESSTSRPISPCTFFPLVALAALIVACLMPGKSRSIPELATLLASLAVAGSALLLIAAHLLAGIPYPQNRTGIYFIPLATLAALGLARILTARSGPAHSIGLALGVVL